MGWLDTVTSTLEWLTERIDPGTPVDDATREHLRGAQLWQAPAHLRGDSLIRRAGRDMRRWEGALLRAHPGDEPGVRLFARGGLTRRQETEGLALVGAPGVGKTLTLRRIIGQARSRGDLVLIHDAKGEYTSTLLAGYPHETALLAPWDTRTVPWTLGADLRTRLDAAEGAATLVPDIPGDRQPFWRQAARAVLEGMLLDEIAEHHGTLPWTWSDLWHDWLVRGHKAAAARLSRSGEGRAAATFIAGETKRASPEEVWSTVMSLVAPLKHLAAAWPEAVPTRSISVRSWLAGETPYRMIILSTLSQYRELGKTVARLWIELTARQLLSMPDNPSRAVWLILDEVATLGELPALLQLAVQGRAKGARIAVGTQDIGQLRAAWGRDRAMSLLNACSTLLLFRTSDVELAEWGARALGRAEVAEWSPSEGQHHGDHSGRSTGWTQQIRESYLVLPSELAQLRPLSLFVRIPGWPCVMPWQWTLPPAGPAIGAPIVLEAEWVSRPIALDYGDPGGHNNDEDDGGDVLGVAR
jgi:hypothetical protein